jgi:hypothetical protein
MKKLFLLLAICNLQFVICNCLHAQSPQSFKYQSVVRDGTGALAINRIISIRTSILAGTATGSSVYTETQTLSTNDYGVVSLNIGAGTVVSGSFATISWGSTDYFVKTELDITGGSTYIFMGTSQILSVPYALYAQTAGVSTTDHDTSATNELQTLSVAGHNLSISSGNTVALPPPQTVSIIGDSLHISSGNTIYLSGAVDLDSDPTNELQNLSLNHDSLTINRTNSTVVFPHDNDRDSTNEIQNLSIAGRVISLTKANSITLNDNDSTNEIQQLSINQGTIHITKGNSISLPDSSATNELQNLSISGGTVGITNGNTILLPDSSATNELQNLSITNDNLYISQGNSVFLNSTQSLQFPEGTIGDAIIITVYYPSFYTVPSGKNLYITSCATWLYNMSGAFSSTYFTLSGGNSLGLPVIPENTPINIQTSTGFANGVLVNKNPYIQIVDVELTTTISYTVPSGKTFYLKSINYSDYLSVNGIAIGTSVLPSEQMLVLPSGTILASTLVNNRITGYLR